MEFDTRVKLAVYRHFVEATKPPDVAVVAKAVDSTPDDVRAAFGRLFQRRVLVLEPDGEVIRMAPPFSGVATQHRVQMKDRQYYANCAWDALGVPAALQKPATVRSRCEQSLEPLQLEVSTVGPERSDWLFHCVVPAAHWWDDIVFT